MTTMNMNIGIPMGTRYIPYQPVRFFALVFLLSWLPWIAAAHSSTLPDQEIITLLLSLAGLLGPVLGALLMIETSGNRRLGRDCRNRLWDVSGITMVRLIFVLSLMPLAILLATWLSVQMGHSSAQFQMSGKFVGMLPLALVAALLEELGWRTYGVDSLKGGRSIMHLSLVFAVLWALWHVPLFFIENSYQNGLWDLGPLYVANFFISVLPAAILGNWFYYKSNRSIPAAVLFHFMLVATSELLQTAPLTKCIVTAVLLGVCIILIATDRAFFFRSLESGL